MIAMPLRLATRRFLTAVCLTFLSSVAIAQQKTVTGKVTDANNQSIAGATVTVKGTTTATQTNPDGSFSLNVPAGATLVVSFVGFENQEIAVGDKNTITVGLKNNASSLNEVVVTGYSSQRKKDIIGAVTVVDMENVRSIPAANLGAQLQGQAAGVTVSSTGAPGSPAVVRIRGFQSSGNNNPLYVIDGVPTEDPSVLNPQDVESMQVLKDATATAIYGTRAANGVIIVTTKQGRTGRTNVSYESFVGVQQVTKGMYPDMLNNQEYMEYLRRTGATKHVVFGNAPFAVPDYIIVSPGFKGGVSASDPRAAENLYSLNPLYQILKTTPEGTNWFDAISRNGVIQSHQLSANGGTDKMNYSVGLNYFNQQGTFKNTGYDRYTLRTNTTFKPKTWLRFGENLQVSWENRLGGEQRGEGGAWSQAYRMVPYIPVYDIRGGYGGNGVGESGNGTNPIANLERSQDDKNQNIRLFGNVFAELQPIKAVTLRTSMGIDAGDNFGRFISRRTYERAENQGTTQLTEQASRYLNWTFTNTATFSKVFGGVHDVKVLAGTEAIRRKFRQIRAFGQRFDFDNTDFINLNRSGNLAGDRNVFTDADNIVTISSIFGRVDYAFDGKYLFNATVRRDGASVFGPANRFGIFPSVGFGWRLSEENFMKNISWISDLKLRGGWGTVGSISNANALNAISTFSSTPGSTNYDIDGVNTTSATGYRPGNIGNPNSKWETTESKNIGLDLSILNGKWNFTLDAYQNDTRDLLVRRQRNSLDIIANQPLDNVGTMRNRGFEFQISNRGNFSRDLGYDWSLNFTHYKNKMTKFNNEGTPFFQGLDRFSNALITRNGLPISSFYGYQIIGFYNNQNDVDKGAKLAGQPAKIGTWMYKDVNGDGNINGDDVTVLGNPHPDFTLGGNFSLNYKNFDFNMFLFWNYGNEIYNYTKWYTDMRGFVGGVSKRVLYDSWTPTNQTASLPILQPGLDGFNVPGGFVTSQSNSYYVENGSYLRAKTLQLGYTLPRSLTQRLGLQNVRAYIQGQNLFTITEYNGADPDLSLINNNGTDLYIGVDRSGFPNPKQFLFGLNVSF